jgi:hypothetical protein
MSDSSSITGATNPAGLPEKFTFNISHEEATRVFAMAKRYAPEIPMGYRFQLQFGETQFGEHTRRWVMREQNITGFIADYNTTGPKSGYLTLTYNIIEYITDMFESVVDTTVSVDFSTNLLTLENESTRVSIDLPAQDESALDASLAANSYISMSSGEVAQLGRGLDIFPVTLDLEEITRPFPFLEFTYANEILTARRDWSSYGGPVVSISIPAIGGDDRMFTAFPNALPRELFFADTYDQPLTAFNFSDETPNVLFVNGLSWGIRVELGNETVFEHRHALVQTLSENEIDVDPDERIGWSPIVNCHYDGSDISVEIVKGIEGQPDYFRLSTVVLPESPWNLEIASEINSWNNQWTNVKLVRQETDLVAIRDVVAEEMDLAPEAVVDLVVKAKVVAEVVGVFL